MKKEVISGMDALTFNLLCEASQLSVPDSEREKFMQELQALIDFTGVVREFDADYDDTDNRVCVSISDLREDVAKPSCPAEKLLGNTEPFFDCYVIPKLME
jgi:Asp-tRNA(Asn)/Glu-tRNA(Gln) amidotransferase C subunit